MFKYHTLIFMLFVVIISCKKEKEPIPAPMSAPGIPVVHPSIDSLLGEYARVRRYIYTSPTTGDSDTTWSNVTAIVVKKSNDSFRIAHTSLQSANDSVFRFSNSRVYDTKRPYGRIYISFSAKYDTLFLHGAGSMLNRATGAVEWDDYFVGAKK